MDVCVKYFYKAILMLFLAYAPSHTFKYPLQQRQKNMCANHEMGEFVANPQDCHLFYWCGANGEAVSAACPPNMMFNPQNKLCDTITNSKCEQTTAISTATPNQFSPSSSFSTIQQTCLNAYDQQSSYDTLIFLAHPSKCSQYYMCYYGQALLQECSTDLQWNSRIGKCDLPKNTKCQTEGNTISLPIAATQPTPLGDNGNGIVCPIYGQHIFPHMQRCNMFIYCVKGHAILQRCPFYQYFDIESSCCKLRKKAICIKDLKLEFRKNTFSWDLK